METTRNVNQLFVAKNIGKAATANMVINDFSLLTDGEVCIVDPRNNVQLTTAGYPAGFDGFKVIQRSGSRLIHSDVVKAGTVRKYSITLPATFPKTQQIDYVGYNGTSGAIDVFNSNLFVIRLYVLENSITGFMQQKIKEGFYKSTSAATQLLIAQGLHKSLVKNYSREPWQDIVFERINAGAQSNALAAANVAVAYGSTAIKFDADVTALLAVGGILRFGTSGAGTAPCYVVASVDAGVGAARTYFLDVPWQGTTGTIAAANVETVAAAGDWGIKISGATPAYNGLFFGVPITFKTAIDFNDNQAAVVTNAQAASIGTGNYDVLAKLEKELQSDENVFRVFAESGVIDRTDVLSGTTYDVVIVEYDGVETTSLGSVEKSPKILTIVQAGNGAQADVANIGWITLLNNIIVTTWVTPGAVAAVPTV
jgi:hypothetical protein